MQYLQQSFDPAQSIILHTIYKFQSEATTLDEYDSRIEACKSLLDSALTKDERSSTMAEHNDLMRNRKILKRKLNLEAVNWPINEGLSLL